MKDVIFSHYFPFEFVPDSLLPIYFAEFRDNGVKNMVFTDCFARRLLREPEFFALLKRLCFNSGINLTEMHAPFGECYDLACASPARREQLVKEHIKCMQYASETGCRTYTVHIGAHDSVYLHIPNEKVRPLALESLEKLIPTAEKLGIVIAVENAFERCNTPDEVMYYVDAVDHPNVGCCFDSGHANVMAPTPGKTVEQYAAHMKETVWQGELEFYSGAFEKMARSIVTCHLHDNDGFSDQHRMPGCGTTDWETLVGKLQTQAPALLSIQSEVNCHTGSNSIRQLCDTFRKLFPKLA